MSIDVMKQALEALDSDNPDIQLRAAAALRLAIEQAEKQEPVAWTGLTNAEAYIFINEYIGPVNEWNLKAVRAIEDKLRKKNTAPPQRQPLTDEELDTVTQKWAGAPVDLHRLVLCREYARAIERAHGIGGEA
jgi:hypothetical protein